jgi:hypothetical protein
VSRREDMFTAAEMAVLRASDRIVDQQEPGGALYRLDRGLRRRSRGKSATPPAKRRGS